MQKPNIQEISNSTTYSLNPFVDKQLHDKYHNHIDRIIQIVSKQQRQKCKKQVKKIIQISQTQKKLKQQSRNFKEQFVLEQRKKHDFIMIKHMSQMKSITRKQMNGDRTALKILKKNKQNKKEYKLTEQQKNMNKKMMSAIMSTSILDVKKYQKSLQVRVDQYLKLRNHMQKIKTRRQNIKTQIHRQNDQQQDYPEKTFNNQLLQKNSLIKDFKEDNQKKSNMRVRTQSTSKLNFSHKLAIAQKMKPNLKLKKTVRSNNKISTQPQASLQMQVSKQNKQTERSNINIQIDISQGN